MPDAAELLEARITDLRTAVRRAVASGDRVSARRLRGELRVAEAAWDEAVLGEDADVPDDLPQPPARPADTGLPTSPPHSASLDPASPHHPTTASGRADGPDRALATGAPAAAAWNPEPSGPPGRSAGQTTTSVSPPRPGDPDSATAQSDSAVSRRLLRSVRDRPAAPPTRPDADRRQATTPRTPAPSVPVREHVHRALTLLGAPSAPKLVLQVHAAFYSGDIVPARLTSLRRDEERSFRAAPLARPYYICAALTADLLAPARGLMALSTWPLHRRVVGPLSPRVDLLSAAIRLAEHLDAQAEPTPEARRLIWRLANSIPGVTGTPDTIDARAVKHAAQQELAVHKEDDARHRDRAAHRAAQQLDNPAQLFGVRLTVAGKRQEEVG
ncbi:hypothetical protein [Nocardia thailandica]|uniref:hypothetical protein n=1 Tax=Nocardia thailandica TaxID=257275 RepID=UPI001C3F2EAD|nr:hypothetical protein [Nocardia thailandica]